MKQGSAASIADHFGERLSLPLIAAPMFRLSGRELVKAACRNGVIGAFPTANCRSIGELDEWLGDLAASMTKAEAPFCPNLIMRRDTLDEELACLVRHRVEMVITSVGSPARVVKPLHDIGCLVFSDVSSVRHAHKAIGDGADGLVLLTAGAGGQTGWANGFAFVRAVRSFFDGPLVLAGGLSDGISLRAATILGCDLGYMGTRFIATRESLAADAYKQMLITSTIDDVMQSKAFTGLDTNMLVPSIVAAGLDPVSLPDDLASETAAAMYSPGGSGPQRWRDLWSAGHSVASVGDVPTVAELVRRLASEFRDADQETSRTP